MSENILLTFYSIVPCKFYVKLHIGYNFSKTVLFVLGSITTCIYIYTSYNKNVIEAFNLHTQIFVPNPKQIIDFNINYLQIHF